MTVDVSGWRSWGRRVRTYHAHRVRVVAVRAFGRVVRVSAAPASVSVTWHEDPCADVLWWGR